MLVRLFAGELAARGRNLRRLLIELELKCFYLFLDLSLLGR